MGVPEAFSFHWSYCFASASGERWVPKLGVGWGSLRVSHTCSCSCVVVVWNLPGGLWGL